MEGYRLPFRTPGEDRRVMLDWCRSVPLDGETTATSKRIEQYAEWLTSSDVAKLDIVGNPGALQKGKRLE
jgi:haloalkane dehalogenase